ncbi:MAG: CcdB family protein [Gemmatimonadaceae bacterium]|jgi:toxin CcdB|nr:CcdB family protein [Gemmatimonadaceae bacterium]
MAQFVVYRNAHPATRQATPLLLEVQHDLLSTLATTVVVPLRPVSAMKGAILRTLTPIIEVEGREYVLVTPELAGVPRKAGPGCCRGEGRGTAQRREGGARSADQRNLSAIAARSARASR